MRAVRRAFIVGALSALVLAGVPSATAQTPTVTSVVGSAEGLSVGLTVTPLVGDPLPLNVGPTPVVTLPPGGGSVSDSVLSINETVLGVGLTSGTLVASAEGALGPAGFATADAVVEDLALAVVGALGIIDADVISATCSSGLGGVSGTTTLTGVNILGTDLDVSPAPNSALVVNVPGVATATLTLNRQVANPDGSLSVTALAIELDVSIIDTVTIGGALEISTATCGVAEGAIPAPEDLTPAQPVPASPRFTG